MPFTTLAKSLNKALMKSWMLMIDIHGCVEGGVVVVGLCLQNDDGHTDADLKLNM